MLVIYMKKNHVVQIGESITVTADPWESKLHIDGLGETTVSFIVSPGAAVHIGEIRITVIRFANTVGITVGYEAPRSIRIQRLQENPYSISFERFTILFPLSLLEDCGHSGSCDVDVARWSRKFQCPVHPQKLADELREFGAWTDEELEDHGANWERLIWIAAGNYRDQQEQEAMAGAV